MVESVQTGGLMKFKYDKGQDLRLKPRQRKEIEEAYEKYYDRRKDEEKKKKVFLILLIIALLILILILIFSSF